MASRSLGTRGPARSACRAPAPRPATADEPARAAARGGGAAREEAPCSGAGGQRRGRGGLSHPRKPRGVLANGTRVAVGGRVRRKCPLGSGRLGRAAALGAATVVCRGVRARVGRVCVCDRVVLLAAQQQRARHRRSRRQAGRPDDHLAAVPPQPPAEVPGLLVGRKEGHGRGADQRNARRAVCSIFEVLSHVLGALPGRRGAFCCRDRSAPRRGPGSHLAGPGPGSAPAFRRRGTPRSRRARGWALRRGTGCLRCPRELTWAPNSAPACTTAVRESTQLPSGAIAAAPF